MDDPRPDRFKPQRLCKSASLLHTFKTNDATPQAIVK